MENIAAYQRRCPLCNSEKNSLIKPLRYALFNDIGSTGESPLVSCENCGFVYNIFNGGNKALQNYYRINDYYVNAKTRGAGDDSPIEKSRYCRLLQLLAPSLRYDSSILDVGCGKGGFLKYLSEQGYQNLHGVEASDACRNHIQAVSNIAVYAHITEAQTTVQADCIILSHVLEHVYHPVDFIEELLNAANPDALVYIELPNTLRLTEYTQPWLGLYFEHINHFDDYHLQMLTEKIGLDVISRSAWSFSPEDEDQQECIFAVCLKSAVRSEPKFTPSSRLAESLQQSLTAELLSPDRQQRLLALNQPLALWGISQYAMLLMGMYSEITKKCIALFDESPAKIGRRIQDKMISHPENLATLPSNSLLLLPQSSYTAKMVEKMAEYGYLGEYEVV